MHCTVVDRETGALVIAVNETPGFLFIKAGRQGLADITEGMALCRLSGVHPSQGYLIHFYCVASVP